jgi:hypothetical protein
LNKHEPLTCFVMEDESINCRVAGGNYVGALHLVSLLLLSYTVWLYILRDICYLLLNLHYLEDILCSCNRNSKGVLGLGDNFLG